MCFGPVASFAASGVLASIGAVVIKNIRHKREILFAAFPMLFALQQLIEGFIWLEVQSGKPQTRLSVLTFAFLFFAYSLWPILCPLSVYLIEYNKKRKNILRALILMGIATSLYLLYFIATKSLHASAINYCMHYETHVTGPMWFTGVYFAVIVFPYFFSSHKSILVFGIPNLIFCFVAYFLYNWAFISVWCFFAAILSLTLYVFLRKLHHQSILPKI